MAPKRGYQEFDHTADWGIHVWAEDFPSLLCTAAEGMFALLEVDLDDGEDSPVSLSIPATGSHESLLVDFLNELLFLSERDSLAFVGCEVKISKLTLKGELLGRPMISQGKEIKAVTFHSLEVQMTPKGYEAKIVFDV